MSPVGHRVTFGSQYQSILTVPLSAYEVTRQSIDSKYITVVLTCSRGENIGEENVKNISLVGN